MNSFDKMLVWMLGLVCATFVIFFAIISIVHCLGH